MSAPELLKVAAALVGDHLDQPARRKRLSGEEPVQRGQAVGDVGVGRQSPKAQSLPVQEEPQLFGKISGGTCQLGWQRLPVQGSHGHSGAPARTGWKHSR